MKMHIGKEIERKFQESGLKLPVFADKINTGERNVYSIFKREDISADMLSKISSVLNFNFFELYQQNLDPNILQENGLEKIKIEQTISFSLNLSLSKDKFGQLPELLREIGLVASKHGMKIL